MNKSEVVRPAQQLREREVMAALRRSRWVSVFWLQEPFTRWAALNRMEKRGDISIKVMGYPMYRVTIHKPNTRNQGQTPQGENHE